MSKYLRCIWHKISYWFIGESFQNDEEWRLLHCDSILDCHIVQGFDLCKLDDLSCHDVDAKSCKITKYGISVQIQVCRVKLLQGWGTARFTHCYSGYDVTIATYSSLADLLLPKMTNASLVAPESNGLSCACAVWSPYSLTPSKRTTRANNTS